MTASFNIFSLPDDVVVSIITDWLEMRFVVARLDNAICNRKLRSHFLRTVYGGPFAVLKVNRDKVSCERCVRWCLLRNVRVDGMWIGPILGSDANLRNEFLSTAGVKLRWINIKLPVNGDVLFEVGKYCPNLAELAIGGVGSTTDTVILCQHLINVMRSSQNLRSLRLEHSMLAGKELGKALGYARHLECLVWLHGCGYVPSTVSIPTLTYLDIRACHVPDATVVAIGEKCPLLRTLLCYDGSSTTLSDHGARAVLTGCPALRRTDIVYCIRVSKDIRLALAERCGIRLEL